jgi:CTP synthase
MKYIIITGGVISGIGKGITASSIGLLLKHSGYIVTMVKIDPYLNIDAGTMSPFEHGECYVLKDGGEVDLDLGNYERFLNIKLSKDNNITSGKVYNSVIQKERMGKYLGKTVQIIPHLTNEIIHQITSAAKMKIDNKIPDVCIIEVGGTVGDIESMPFIESLRQMYLTDTMCFVHVSKLIKIGEEYKTKPTQSSIRTLFGLGITPKMLVIRTDKYDIHDNIKKKLSLFCQVSSDMIIANPNVNSIYHVPLLFEKQNVVNKFIKLLNLPERESQDVLTIYRNITTYESNTTQRVKCLMVCKYLGNDTYLSIRRALEHAALAIDIVVDVYRLDSESIIDIEKHIDKNTVVIIPGGFGQRGIEGKINVIRYCRKNNVSILGICFGFQLMVIELFRVFNSTATSEEFYEYGDDNSVLEIVTKIQPEKEKEGITKNMGGTMRLGEHECNLDENSLSYKLYKNSVIKERYRHRYEVNILDVEELGYNIKSLGIKFTGKSKNGCEIIEKTNHPFYIGCQFHPEFSSKLETPHPLFVGLLNSVKKD